jgi:hypothetical protein
VTETVGPLSSNSGKRVVAVVYVGVVALAGVMGYALGVILPEQHGVSTAELGPVAFEITPASFALYGMTMLAVTLGVLLLAVQVVSNVTGAADDG